MPHAEIELNRRILAAQEPTPFFSLILRLPDAAEATLLAAARTLRSLAAQAYGDWQAIVAAEHNPERRAFYELCWHLGGAQSDLASLTAEDIDWQTKAVSFARSKTGTVSIIRFGGELERILRSLPQSGPLFPKLKPMREAHRATEFRRACRRLKISGITLHSYRYAWAERARSCGYPERFAQEALGHQSKAIHRA